MTFKCDIDLGGRDSIVALCTSPHNGDYLYQVIYRHLLLIQYTWLYRPIYILYKEYWRDFMDNSCICFSCIFVSWFLFVQLCCIESFRLIFAYNFPDQYFVVSLLRVNQIFWNKYSCVVQMFSLFFALPWNILTSFNLLIFF